MLGIDANEERYRAMLAEPAVINESAKKDAMAARFAAFADAIFSQDLADAKWFPRYKAWG